MGVARYLGSQCPDPLGSLPIPHQSMRFPYFYRILSTFHHVHVMAVPTSLLLYVPQIT